jgi:hypothetical protein
MANTSKTPKSSVIYYDIPSAEDVFLYTEGGVHPIRIGGSLKETSSKSSINSATGPIQPFGW